MKNVYCAIIWLMLRSAYGDPLFFDGRAPIKPADLNRHYKGNDLVYSTNREFALQIFKTSEKDGSDFVVMLLDGKDSNIKSVIYQGTENVTAGWSSDGKLVYVKECPGAGESYICIGRPDREGNALSVDWIYLTPRYRLNRDKECVENRTWNILRWNTAHGTVTLECSWNYTSGSPYYKKEFDIPLTYEAVPGWRAQSGKTHQR